MKIKRYYEFKENLIQEADEDEFALGEEGDDAPSDEEGDGDEEEEEEEEKPFNDNPESYLKGAITKLKRKIEALFSDNENEEENIVKPESIIGPEGFDRTQKKSKKKNNMTLKDMGAKLESSDISKTSKTHKSLIVKFTDDGFYYSLYVKVSLKEALNLIKDGEELTDESIQKAYVKMKKISVDTFEEIDTIYRNVMMADIDEDFIIELKLELDEISTGDDDKEDFSIET